MTLAHAALIDYERRRGLSGDPFDPLHYVRPPGQPGPAKGFGYTWPTYGDLVADYRRYNARPDASPWGPLTRGAFEDLSGVAHQTVSTALIRFQRTWKQLQQDAQRPNI
jgi:hypothetical protein